MVEAIGELDKKQRSYLKSFVEKSLKKQIRKEVDKINILEDQ